jgi:hypothetical protein
MAEVEVDGLERWLVACREAGVEAAVIRKTSEIRPVAGEGHAVTVGSTSYTTLVGYRAGALIKVRLDGLHPHLKRRLEVEGFRVREVWDQIG